MATEQPWYLYKTTQGFSWTPSRTKNHSGIDIGTPLGTPVTSPVAGTVVGAGCHPWGIQVDVRFTSGSETLVWSALHLMQLAPQIKVGTVVQPGTLLGYSGGVSSGVPCPTDRKYSGGAHLHMELTHGGIPPYTTYNPRRPTAESYPINPTTFLAALRSGGMAGVVSRDATGSPIAMTAADFALGNIHLGMTGVGTTGSEGDPGAGATASAVLAEVPGFFGICAALDVAERFVPYSPPGGLTGVASTPGYTAQWIIKNGLAFISRTILMTLGVFLLLAVIASLININKWLQEASGIVIPLAVGAM